MKIPLPIRYRTPVLILLTLFVVLPPALFYHNIISPSGSGKTVEVFNFAQGQPLKKFASALEGKNIIRNASMFVWYARLHGDAGRLKAGYYRFSDGMSPAEILRIMVAGDVYVLRLTVPEGYSIYQIAEIIEGRQLFDKDDFLRECCSPSLLKELGIQGKSVEGYLFPSTYDINPGASPADLIRKMVEQFDKVYDRDFAKPARETGWSERDIVILASMIEKEAVIPGERPIISSVFHNRISKGMPLQSDPTAVYGIRAFSGNVSKQDITRNSPYNTYLISGLPPGPIGNPSCGAIEAAIRPAATGYLYFVAKKDGSHYFSRTLEEHNLAVKRFLKP